MFAKINEATLSLFCELGIRQKSNFAYYKIILIHCGSIKIYGEKKEGKWNIFKNCTWQHTFCSFELKTLHSYHSSFPYPSWLKKRKTKWAPQAVIWVFRDIQYNPIFSINYITINKDLEKLRDHSIVSDKDKNFVMIRVGTNWSCHNNKMMPLLISSSDLSLLEHHMDRNFCM